VSLCAGITDAGLTHLTGIHTLNMYACNPATIAAARALRLRVIEERFFLFIEEPDHLKLSRLPLLPHLNSTCVKSTSSHASHHIMPYHFMLLPTIASPGISGI
jgi:hypothetical protein